MHAEVISIGTEILMGEIVDTNSAYLASELARLGIELRWVSKVGDDPERLFDVINRAWHRSDATLTTGGLGPTSDDLTRETVARVLGEEMAIQQDLLEHLKGLFAGRGAPMPETNVKQATLIPSAEAIPNPMGTAPGWWVERDGNILVAMPGPPRELNRMWSYEVAPRLRQLNPGVAIVTRTLKTFGISEGGLDQMLTHLFEGDNPSLGIYSREDGIHLRAIATAPSEREARDLVAPMEAEIRAVVGDDAIWGEDDETPTTQVAAMLTKRRLTLGIMEGFTGGLLASNLAEAASAQDFLKGSLVVNGQEAMLALGVDPQVVEQSGPVSGQAAEAMARAACARLGADVGVGVTGVVTQPTASSGPLGTSYIG
ncbi:MAG: CinA family nicotinamide mononucleotide deamidase-related protein, partial [Nitrospinota bacterium]